jgi:hypothetical protein
MPVIPNKYFKESTMGYRVLKQLLVAASFAFSLSACAMDEPQWRGGPPQYSHEHNPIRIEVISDSGHIYSTYSENDRYKTHRSYLEAKQGERYKIRVRNRTNKRIGVVLAVDGRNIISGKKSYLGNKERMYVLGPYETATYKGWRTSQNRVNRFYFTNSDNSYAGAWGDFSAMGVIAAAVYYEQPRYYDSNQYNRKKKFSNPRFSPNSAMKPQSPAGARASEDAGTGYGREEHSRSRRVNFVPNPAFEAKYFYKYEWRSTLCDRGIIDCYNYERPEHPYNRFWREGGRGDYAPPPPGIYYRR